MSLFQAFILGAIQGITEFLPISSSGHLILVPELFGWPDQGVAFDVAVHVATLGAILVVFSKDVKTILVGMIGSRNREEGRVGWLILIATIPAVLVGLFLGDQIETTFRSAEAVAVSLAFWGVVLAVADLYASRRSKRVVNSMKNMSIGKAIVIGVAQAVALIPGTSRSGITISAGLFSGLDRLQAARFSFLLAIPSIMGAAVLTAVDVTQSGTSIDPLMLLVGFISAFIFGILSIRFLLRLIAKTSYAWFTAYRLLLAATILILLS